MLVAIIAGANSRKQLKTTLNDTENNTENKTMTTLCAWKLGVFYAFLASNGK